MATRDGEFNISMTPTRIQVLFMVLLCQTVGFVFGWLLSPVENGCLGSWGPTQTWRCLTKEKRKFFPLWSHFKSEKHFLKILPADLSYISLARMSHMPPLKPFPEKGNGMTTDAESV